VAARLDVWPSGMGRDMGDGRKAYIHRLDRASSRDDLVDIFDPCKLEEVASVEEQGRYHDEWFDSRLK